MSPPATSLCKPCPVPVPELPREPRCQLSFGIRTEVTPEPRAERRLSTLQPVPREGDGDGLRTPWPPATPGQGAGPLWPWRLGTS